MPDTPHSTDSVGTSAERRAVGVRRPDFDSTSRMLMEAERLRLELATEAGRLREALRALREKARRH